MYYSTRLFLTSADVEALFICLFFYALSADTFLHRTASNIMTHPNTKDVLSLVTFLLSFNYITGAPNISISTTKSLNIMDLFFCSFLLKIMCFTKCTLKKILGVQK